MKIILKPLAGMVATLGVALASQAYPANFVGTWVNTNPHTKGIVRLVITPDLRLRAYGQCTPTPCDIGITQLWTYGKSISDRNHKAATGHFGLSFKDIQVVAKLQSNHRLYFEDYNHFTDTSGRESYWRGEKFRKLSSSELSEDFNSSNSEPEN